VAPVQITAEQIMREAQERQLEVVAPPSRQRIDDPEELAEFQLQKRKGFEDAIRKNRFVAFFGCMHCLCIDCVFGR
jgi:crooked neck